MSGAHPSIYLPFLTASCAGAGVVTHTLQRLTLLPMLLPPLGLSKYCSGDLSLGTGLLMGDGSEDKKGRASAN